MTLDLSLSHIIGAFAGEHSFPRELIPPKPRLVVTVKVPERSVVSFVRIFWTGPSAGNKELYRRPFKHEHAPDGNIVLFFSRKWHTERSGYRAEIGFKKINNAYTIDLAAIPTVQTQSEIDALPEINVQGNIVARAYILDMIPSSCPEAAKGHFHPNNLIGHSLFLADHHHRHRSIKNAVEDVLGTKKRASKGILQDFLSNYPGLNLGVEHIRDFIGAIFNRLTTFPDYLIKTVERLAQLPAVLEHILKDLWAYINSLIAAAEHKFLSNKESYIYPPPPVHISEDGKTWQNWGNSLRSNPAAIYSDNNARYRSLTSLQQIQEVIAAAKANKKLQPVRVFGSAHSWASIVQTTGTLLDGRKFGWLANNPKDADVFNQATVEKYIDYKYLYVTPQNDLIGGLPTVTFPPGIATGTLERWIYYQPKDQQGRAINTKYSLGTTTYEDVFTMGGIVAAACHGTGRNYPTVSDWLVSVEFVDANSLIRRVDVNGDAWVKQHEAENWSKWDVEAEFNETGLNLFKAVICNYGLFGVLWSLTIRIIEGFDTLFIAEMVPWLQVLDDTEQSRKNLNDLQNRSNSLEFFYYPFGSKGLSWEKNPGVYLLRHVHATPETEAALQAEGYEIVTKSEDYFLLRDLKTRVFSGIFYNIITTLLKIATKVPFVTQLILPYVLSQMPNNLEYTAKGTKKEAIRLPHWRANHSVNAVGAVENIRVLNIEWTVPMTFNDPSGDGLKHALGIHSHVIKSIHNAADQKQFPITVVAEIRFFRGSGALLAPEYDSNFYFPLADPFENPQKPYGGWAAPEMVTGVHNPWWTEFYTRMNEEVFGLINNEVPVRNHLAKQYASLPNQFARLRAEFDREPTKPFSKFRELRQKLDPAGVFLPPAMHQFLDTTNPQYVAPPGYLIDEDGRFEDLQKS